MGGGGGGDDDDDDTLPVTGWNAAALEFIIGIFHGLS